MTAMPPEFVSTFRDSMPPSYRQHLSSQDIVEHAEIAWRRGDELAHAEIWCKRPNAIVICVVADDRPGLATLIRATVVAHELNVSAEQCYSRKNERGSTEVVHFLWLDRTHDGNENAVLEQDISGLRESLCQLLRGETDLDAVIERVSSAPPAPPPESRSH
jgi:UTP:GlnB (protein PII) uridylyltransferase